MSKEELSELQNPDSWEDMGAQTSPPQKPRAVASVAFSREDFEIVVEAARQQGMKTSEFIRHAALEKATPAPSKAQIFEVSGVVRTEYTVVSAPRAKTTVTTTPEPSVYATA